MVFGSAFDLDVALMVYGIPRFGSGIADMYGSAHLTGIEVHNASGQLVTDFTVTSGSGTLYTADGVQSAVPEPGTFLLAACSLALALFRRRQVDDLGAYIAVGLSFAGAPPPDVEKGNGDSQDQRAQNESGRSKRRDSSED